MTENILYYGDNLDILPEYVRDETRTELKSPLSLEK